MHLTAPEDTFIQPMYDFTAPRYAAGRLALAGDAATVARPHTGGGAVKALQDATALQTALASATDWPEALAAYDAVRSPVGRSMVDLGRRLGLGLVQETPDWSAMDQPGRRSGGNRRMDPARSAAVGWRDPHARAATAGWAGKLPASRPASWRGSSRRGGCRTDRWL